ncbi:MAG: hypothetical protein IJT38_03700 [Clostridia bacterium]|nr:hypothetical protein [Clostridia bacterium]MBQ7718381.1 hypothetical protein [Clostridia bacterium]
MPKYSEQDLKYAAEFREEIHREALAIVRKTRPNATEVVDRHSVEDYFQENWEYPGKLYTVVAIPYGYKSREALVDAIVRDTLSGRTPEKERANTQELQEMANKASDKQNESKRLDAKTALLNGKLKEEEYDRLTAEPKIVSKNSQDPFYLLLADYPDLVVDYCIVDEGQYCGYESHRKALKTAYIRICRGWNGDPDKATGKKIASEEMFSSDYKEETLNYRKAFLYPPHRNSYNGRDFVRVNAALFPNGTDGLEVFEWNTDWSEYFDEGHEWWGALCLTAYDKTLDRFVIIMASATD